MNKVIDLNLTLKNLKLTNTDLKEYQYKYNNEIFEFNYTYAITPLLDYLKHITEHYGTEVSQYQPQNKTAVEDNKKLLQALRNNYKIIANAIADNKKSGESEDFYINKVVQYEIYKTIEAKKNNNKDHIRKQLEKNKIMCEIYGDSITDKFKETHAELVDVYLSMLKEDFEIK